MSVGYESELSLSELEPGVLLISIQDPSRARAESRSPALSESELAVARLAARNLSNQQIAAQRGSSQKTIANQLASAYKKLGISGRRELRAELLGVSR